MTHEISNKNTETRNKHCNHANKDLKSSRIFNWTPQLAANKKTEKILRRLRSNMLKETYPIHYKTTTGLKEA
jgi:hypothetical protein